MIIVPAILTDKYSELEKMLHQAEEFAPLVQIDIMDGEFVPSRSITVDDFKKNNYKIFTEIHLMVKHPQKYIAGFKKAGAKRIIFHFESSDNTEETIEKIQGAGLEVGLAINPQTKLNQIKEFFGKIDLLLLLSVNPGFYGSKFIPEVLDKAKELKNLFNRKFIIALDGGVGLDNIEKIYAAGVENACVGSRIFASGDPKENYMKFVAKFTI